MPADSDAPLSPSPDPAGSPPPPAPQQPNPKETDPRSPLNYEPPKLVMWVGVAFGFVLIYGAIKLVFFSPRIFGSLFGAVYVVVIGNLLLRRLKRSFIDVQSRTIEWLAAIAFVGVLMAIVKNLFTDNLVLSDDRTSVTIVTAIPCVIWAFGGAAWGWSIARRMKEQNGRRRLWYICAAWLAVPGVLGLLVVAVSVITLCVHLYFFVQGDTSAPLRWEFLGLLAGAVLGALVIPAWRLDRAAPNLASEQLANNAWKPTVIDRYDACEFGPRPMKPADVLLNLTGFNLIALPVLLKRVASKQSPLALQSRTLDDFPATVRDFVNEYHEDLRELGFEQTLVYQGAGSTKNVASFSTHYVHREKGQAAVLAAVYVLTHLGGQLHGASFEVSSVFADDTIVSTSNSNTLGFPAKPSPLRHVMRFPEIHDVRQLHRVHCARLKKLGRDAAPGVIKPEHCDLAGLTRELQKHVDLEFSVLRTWKGATLDAWSIVWPASIVRNRATRRRARAELKALGLD